MGAIIKEIKSNHWFPRKEEVDEYIASKDKDKYKRESILRRSAVSAGLGATGAVLGASIPYAVFGGHKYVSAKDYLKYAGIGAAAAGVGGGIGGAISGHIRNKRVARLAMDPEKYEEEFEGSKYPTAKEINSYINRNK